jgi:MYXO-CTERM domain-containing protein
MAVPTSPGHDPELAGECTEPAGEAACLSRVCEARDDLCGYLEGTPCADDRQCRSDICAPSGLCAVCDETTPCPTGSICDVPTGTCLPEGSDAGPVDGGMGGRPGGLAGGALCAVRPGSRPAPGVVWVALLVGLALVIGRRRQG